MDSLASFLKKLSLDDDEFSKESILAQPDFQPFLFPSRPVSFSGVPTQGPVDAYLKAVRSQILAEYDALLGRGSVLRLACTILEDDSEDSDDGSTLFRDSSTRTIEQQEILEIWQLKTPATPYSRSNPPVTDIETVVERSSLHTHLAVVRGRIALLRWNRRPEVLTAFIGASWPGHASARVASLDLTTEGDAVLVDCGYIGDLINEPLRIRQKGGQHRAKDGRNLSSSVPINERQKAVLDGMTKNIEGIQGPPGTGKSTVIYHVIRSYVPVGDIVLATCVQNKAVDAIAEKFAVEKDIPFFVFGNPERLGLLAKSWTLESQVDRDPRVVVVKRRLSRHERIADLLEKRCAGFEKAALPFGGLHSRKREAMADTKFGKVTRITPEDVRDAREKWPANDPWQRAWKAVMHKLHPVEFWALAEMRRKIESLHVELAETKAQVRAELVASARAVLCTVATVSRSLLTNDELVPLVRRVGTAVLDEAGTCPETKLPLLLCLPALERIIAIGDQNQLQPFTLLQTQGGSGASTAGGDVMRAPRGICNAFWTGKPCRFGASCNFQHVRGPEGESNERTKTVAEPQGFFQRLAKALGASAIPSLTHQYRMHPAIARYVSSRFYHSTLSTPLEIQRIRVAADKQALYWLSYTGSMDIASGGYEQDPAKSTSKHNPSEAAAVLAAYRTAARAGYLQGRSVYILTFYKAQFHLWRDTFDSAGLADFAATPTNALLGAVEAAETEALTSTAAARSAEGGVSALRILTVDQAQGSEADVVFLSCVRSNGKRTVGFLGNPNRMNVAVSRARERIVVVGDSSTLCANANWKALHDGCARFVDPVDLPTMSRRVVSANRS